jgi:uncharacterized protein YbjT (DUF2867 family)
MARHVFLTGGTGYLGRALIPELLARRHRVRALVRPRSVAKLPPGCEVVVGDALDASTFEHRVEPGDVFVQLVGTPHPSPAKAQEFREVDLVAARESVRAAQGARAGHFVYVSVARPAPVMRAYQAVRAEAERCLLDSGLPATVLRPWYVLGPGHRWPYLLLPVYALLERLPATREGARRLGLVTLRQMVAALVAAVEATPAGVRLVEVPEIRAAARALSRPGEPLAGSLAERR